MSLSWAKFGTVLSYIIALIYSADAAVGLFFPSLLTQAMQETGFGPDALPVIGCFLVVSVILYVIPRTAIMGAILFTGFIGGAYTAHLRIGELASPPQLFCLVLGGLTWLALLLRFPAKASALYYSD